MGCAASAESADRAPLQSAQPARKPVPPVPSTQSSAPSAKPVQPAQPAPPAQSSAPSAKPVQPAQQVPQVAQQVSQSQNSKTKGILISCHSTNKGLASRVAELLSSKGFDPLVITESSPAQLSLREQAVKWAQVVVLVASFKYQRNQTCLELANYAKDTKKPLQTMVVQPNYRPSGNLGALSIAGGRPIDFRQAADQGAFDRCMSDLVKALESKTDNEPTDVLSKPNATDDDEFSRKFEDVSSAGKGIFISYHSDASSVAKLVSGGRGTSNSLSEGGVTLGNPSANNLAAIKACKTFIAVMSEGYQNSAKFQEELECARAGKKKIVPVNGVRGFHPSGWLALAIAGKLYYVLLDQGQAYEHHPRVPDSNPMNDFVYAVLAADPPTEDEVEQAELAALRKQLDEAKAKLGRWPPPKRPVVKEEELPLLRPEDLAPKSDENLIFNYIHHEVTRMTFNPPKPLFDDRGVPTKQKFDVMLSYQWDIQDFVRDVYMDLDMRNFKAWMDIWGGMVGNINSAMAAAVETSSVLLSFLTERYQQSVNCNLELKYAMARQKPIIFIKAERNLVLRDWIQEAVSKSLVFEMYSIKDAGVMDNGVPRINRISEAIRKLVSWEARRVQVREDVSEEVFQLQEQLEDALHQIHEEEGTKRYETCSRCQAKYDENSTDGCKKHTAYFMGGTILAGRWVCCQQRDKTSPGCENCKHITQPRKFTPMPGHDGCFKWNPE